VYFVTWLPITLHAVRSVAFLLEEQAPGPAAADPPPESLRERKKRLTRAAIFDAAQRLFAERGFDDVTVAQIADAANISVKTLFSYVRSKEELVFGDGPTVLDAVVAAVRDRRVGQTPLVAAAKALLAAADDAPAGRPRPSAADNSNGAGGYSAGGSSGGEPGGGCRAAGGLTRLDTFRRMAQASPESTSRLRALWEEAEDQLTAVLAKPGDGPRERAARRLEAAQIMVLVRTVTSREVADLIAEAGAGPPRARASRMPPPASAPGAASAPGTLAAPAGQEALREWIREAAGSLARGLQATRR
jgi:AcrR family transcriptional regulator